MKRILCCLLSVIVVSTLVCSPALAQEETAHLELQLKKVQQQMEQLEGEYKQEKKDIKAATNEKIVALKREYRKNYNAYVSERKDQESKALTRYNNKMTPLKAEKTKLRELIHPLGSNNFAKTKND